MTTNSMGKLTPTQKSLFDAMIGGVVCHYMPYMGRFNQTAYYYRSDSMAHCTAPAKALLKIGLVVSVESQMDGRHKLVVSDLGRSAAARPEVAIVMNRLLERRKQVAEMLKKLTESVDREEWDSAFMSCELGVTLFKSLREDTNRLADMED